MKTAIIFLCALCALANCYQLLAQSTKPYLGQLPPDTIPKRFGNSSLQSNGIWWWHGSPKFSPDGKEAFITKYHSNLAANNMKIYRMNEVEGIWSSPAIPSFATVGNNTEPVYSKDGNTLYFISDRDGKAKIYSSKREGSDWSEPQIFNLPYDSFSEGLGWDFSFANDCTIYYTVWENSNAEIVKSTPINGQYLNYEKLPTEINTLSHEFSPCISPDGSYLIFVSQKEGGYGASDIYISFRKRNNSWTTPVNLGKQINGSNEDAAPYISTDGKYLFFNSQKNGDYGYNAYWVKLEVLEKYFTKMPYFGETPPDLTPKIFAPGIVSSSEHWEYGIAFSPNGKECFFDRRENDNPAKLHYSIYDVNEWTTPEVSPISDNYFLSCEPCFSHDNKKLFFGWTDSTYNNINISCAFRTDSGWSEPVISGQGMYISTDTSGNMYTGDLSALPYYQYCAKITEKDGVFTNYERISIEPFYGQQAHPCIAPDGSYIIFDKWGEDLYVSFKKPDGTWNKAIRLLEYGFDVKAGGPRISPCGKYLFFHLHGDIWWVSIDAITKLNPYSAIENKTGKNELKIFPNPAKDKITIDCNGYSDSKIEIFNQLGQSVYCKKQLNSLAQIDISKLPSGIYIVEYSDFEGKVNQRLIVE